MIVGLVDGDSSINVHYAFNAATRVQVHQSFDRSDGDGGTRDRAPALAPRIHSHYYAGYAPDPDRRLVEFVCHSSD